MVWKIKNPLRLNTVIFTSQYANNFEIRYDKVYLKIKSWLVCLHKFTLYFGKNF